MLTGLAQYCIIEITCIGQLHCFKCSKSGRVHLTKRGQREGEINFKNKAIQNLRIDAQNLVCTYVGGRGLANTGFSTAYSG